MANAIVRVFTAARMAAIEAMAIVGAYVDGDELMLIRNNAEEFSAGNVRGPQGNPANALSAYPIGSIYINTLSTNPATLLGGGTWVRYGQGRVIVSQDPGQAEFDVSGEVGGAKTHTLTTGEMPSHTHVQNSHNHTQNPHDHDNADGNAGNLLSAAGGAYGVQYSANKTGSTTATNQATTATNQNTGGGGAHNNLQPYIVAYVWTRTA